MSACVAVAVGCLMPACVAMTVGCDWHPTSLAVAVGRDWCPHVYGVGSWVWLDAHLWRWQLDLVRAHVGGGGIRMWLVAICVAVAFWIWLRPSCLAVTVGFVWYPGVRRWQLYVFGPHVCGGGSWNWLVLTCVAVAVGSVCCLSVWQWQLDVIISRVFGATS